MHVRGGQNTYFENMKRLKLNVLALVAEEIHHHLEIRFARDIPGHHGEVRTIQKDLPEEFQ